MLFITKYVIQRAKSGQWMAEGSSASSAGFPVHTWSQVCTSVLIAHLDQVCTGLPTYCAHLVKQQLKDVYTGSSSVLTVCSKCALQCAQAVMLLCTLSLAVYTKSKTDEHT